jgi:hypothetical protein
MKRLMFLAVGLALLGSTPASAWWWNTGKKQTHHQIGKKIGKSIARVHQTPVSSPIPEPTAALVFGTSLLVIGVSKRRRSNR